MEAYNQNRPLASLSLDLDNQWSYMKTHGDAEWRHLPSYLDIFIPMVLDLLDRRRLAITFFIVGQDAGLDRNKTILRELTRRGHEAGNHSFHHEVWLHQYPKEQIRRELVMAEEQILKATGQKPVGFRGPGFTWSPALLEVLAETGYTYDASSLPTFLGPLARMYYFWTADLDSEQKSKRDNIYGSFRDGFRPLKPYYRQLPSNQRLLEIPVTTMPILRSPFHLSYLIYLSRISELLMRTYLWLAIKLCKATATEPSFLLHPLDLLGGDKVPQLAFFPGMDLTTDRKIQLFGKVISILSANYRMVPMREHAEHIMQRLDPHPKHGLKPIARHSS